MNLAQASGYRTSTEVRRDAPLTIVVPVYNEGENFPRLWGEMTASVRSPFLVFVVYDFDADNTVPAVQNIIDRGEERLRLVKNAVKPGVVGAICTGLDLAVCGPVLIVMADLSDDLRVVDQMLALYRQGYDVVVGSRYMRGGRIEGGPLLKKTLSRIAGVSLHYLRGLPTRDATNAFKIYDAAMVRSMLVESQRGFELNLELTVKAFLTGHPITEIPSVWRDRTAGESRFRLWKWLPRYLRWSFFAFRRRQTHLGGESL
jgi:glycosyltransferase involved in cell wall biosynthesis